MPLPSFLWRNDLLFSLVKTPKWLPPSSVWRFSIYDFGQVNSYFCLIRNIIWLHFSLVAPNLREVFVTLFSFAFILSLFISSAWNNPSCLVQFCIAKALFVYLPQHWNSNSVLPILSQSPLEMLLRRFTKFCKGSCHPVYSCVCNSWVVVIIIDIFELQKQNCEIFVISTSWRHVWTFLQGVFCVYKMSESEKPLKRSFGRRQIPNDEDYLSEKLLFYTLVMLVN